MRNCLAGTLAALTLAVGTWYAGQLLATRAHLAAQHAVVENDPAALLTDARRMTLFAPFDPRGWTKTGAALLALHRHGEAAVALTRALDLAPYLAAAENDLAVAYTLAGRHADAVAHISAALALLPHEPKLQANARAIARRALPFPPDSR